MDGLEALNHVIVRHAVAADTTVQEAPIAYPTEVGHMKKIAEKLTRIGKKLGAKTEAAMKALGKKAQDLFTHIRLFTKGKKEQAIEAKKKISKDLHDTVSDMSSKIKAELKTKKEKV